MNPARGTRAAVGPLCAALLLAGACAACPAADPSFEDGTLWRVTAPNGAVGTILGTMHIGAAAELAVPGVTWPLLRQSSRLILEVAPQSGTDGERLQRLPPAESLSRRLDRREWASLRTRIAPLGLPPSALPRYKPWVLTQLLQASPNLPLQPLDEKIAEQAQQAGLEVVALETLAEQFAAFECIDLAEQIVLLKETLAMPEPFFADLNRQALALYRQQHVGALVSQLGERFPMGAAARAAEARSTRCVIDDRNQRFARRLPALLEQTGAFVAIGAAHLTGQAGVLARLSEAGFQLDRLADPEAPLPATAEDGR